MKCTIMIMLALAVCALSAFATPPGIISYQGRLTTPAGTPVPDSNYTVRFGFYNAPEGGQLVFSEVYVVSTKDGLFTAQIGIVIQRDASEFGDTAIYLGIQIVGEPEMTPRTRIGSVPYALQAQAVEGKYFGKNRVRLFPSSETVSQLHLLNSDEKVQIGLVQQVFANSFYMTRLGTTDVAIRSVVRNDSICLTMYNNNGDEIIHLSTLEQGNNAAKLPDSSISSIEMLNEPGLACNDNSSTVVLGTAMSDIVTVTFNAPSNGYVLVNGNGTAFVSGSGSTNYGYVQIDTASGGTADAPYRVAFGSDDMWTGMNVYVPLAASRVFYVNSGSYTFRLEGRTSSSQGSGASLDVRNSMIQAVFIPTSYGTINTMVSASEAGQFVEKEAIQVEGTTMYRVDLRELELRAAKAEAEAERARADAEKAQRELLRAKYEPSEGQNR